MGGAEISPSSLHPTSKKNPGKAPKRIHKAEREKMKREHLNELFLELANALDLTEQNSGKACILTETCRIVKDTLEQIECLKKENAVLLSESQYITVEKDELQDETSTLQIQINELKKVIKERGVESGLDLNVSPTESQEQHLRLYFEENMVKQPPILNPVFMIPNIQVANNKGMSSVMKPNPRYPTPADSWPSHVLERHEA